MIAWALGPSLYVAHRALVYCPVSLSWAYSLCLRALLVCLRALLVYAYGLYLLCLRALIFCYCFTCCNVVLLMICYLAFPNYSLTFWFHPKFLISLDIFFVGKEGNCLYKAINLVCPTPPRFWGKASLIHHPRGPLQSPKAIENTSKITFFG